jgi:hypothetical protein
MLNKISAADASKKSEPNRKSRKWIKESPEMPIGKAYSFNIGY